MVFNASDIDFGVSDLIKPQTTSPDFIIQDPPSASQNMQLALDMLDQDRHRRSKDTALCALKAPQAEGLHGGINSQGHVCSLHAAISACAWLTSTFCLEAVCSGDQPPRASQRRRCH